MKRKIDDDLITWKNALGRLPLLLRGGRQVGKTFAVEKFGRAEFRNLVTINFERDKKFISIFENDLDPIRIVRAIEELTQISIIAGETLLFFDEIQACPRAIMALRYFKEEMEELHVIGAGSLLEFSIQGKDFSFPVGRIEFRYMHPLSFREFLLAANETVSLKRLQEASLENPVSLSLHAHLLNRLRDYFRIGGMPRVIETFLSTSSLLEGKKVQQMILETYRSDFGKYASFSQQKYLAACFEKAPLLVGSYIKYTKIAPEFQSRDLKMALHLIEKAGLIHSIHSTTAAGLPLAAGLSEKKLKILFLDIGLLQEFLHTDPELLTIANLTQLNAGALAEQFVGQELLAYSPPYCKEKLFFWEREKKGSEAEVDYVIAYKSHILPVEVKAGKSSRCRSLQIFMEEKKAPLGIHISQNPLEFHNNILSIPLYLIEDLPNLIEQALKK